jgi:Fe-S cluster biogenesis protein NfuA
MFIQTEETPNPLTLKFIPGSEVLENGTAQYKNAEEAKASPLAEQLFLIGGVEGVFLGSDFISVTKSEATDWDIVKTEILTTIMEHYVAGKPIIHDKNTATNQSTVCEDDDDVVKQIKEIIDTRVRPAVAQDGGDIIFHGFNEGIVQLEMHGACSGCPSSTVTLKSGIENLLKHYVPEVESVEQVQA